jgi:tetratricopeptide (TPR) repeat protein
MAAPDEFRDLAARVAALRAHGQSRQLGLALRELGELTRKRGEAEAARDSYEEAAGRLRLDRADLTLAHTVRHLGDVHREAGRPDLAEPCYLEALMLYGAQPEAQPLDFANALRSMAILRMEAGLTEEGAGLWRQAGELYARLGIEAGVREARLRAEAVGTE